MSFTLIFLHSLLLMKEKIIIFEHIHSFRNQYFLIKTISRKYHLISVLWSTHYIYLKIHWSKYSKVHPFIILHCTTVVVVARLSDGVVRVLATVVGVASFERLSLSFVAHWGTSQHIHSFSPSFIYSFNRSLTRSSQLRASPVVWSHIIIVFPHIHMHILAHESFMLYVCTC